MQTFIIAWQWRFSPLTRILCPAHWQILPRFTRFVWKPINDNICRVVEYFFDRSMLLSSTEIRRFPLWCNRKIVNMRLRMVRGRFYNSFVVRGWHGLEPRAWRVIAWVAICRLRWRMTTDSILFLRHFANVSLTQGNRDEICHPNFSVSVWWILYHDRKQKLMYKNIDQEFLSLNNIIYIIMENISRTLCR